MEKKAKMILMAAAFTASMSMTALAGTWETVGSDWKYKNDDGSYAANTWQWLDGNNDGVAECYYFDGNGYMLANTTTPDGYTVNADGQWMSDGTVQTQATQATQPTQTTSADVMTGYNSDGISNAAIDMLNHTKEENAKYGEIKTFTGNGVYGPLNRVWYSNGLIVEYYTSGVAYNNGLPEEVYTQTPSAIIQNINDTASNAELAEKYLKNAGFSRTYNNCVNAWTIKDNYYIEYSPGTNTMRIKFAD